jgi:hypothetical protein
MKSALQEAADDEASRAEADLMLQHTAEEMGALVEPGSRAHAGNDVSSGGSR